MLRVLGFFGFRGVGLTLTLQVPAYFVVGARWVRVK